MTSRDPRSHSKPDERTLRERAEESVRAELRGDRLGILGALGEAESAPLPAPLSRSRTVPDRWSFST